MTMATELRDIAAKYSLTWPQPYLELADAGMLDITPGAGDIGDGDSTGRPRIPLLHFSTDFEVLSANDVDRRLAMLAEPDDFRNIDPAEGLLPFGMEPNGNLYCFRTGAADGDDVPVVLIQHDEQEDLLLAPDLPGFIFSAMVSATAEFYDDDYLGEDDPRRNADAWLQSHEPFLTPTQVDALRGLFGRPLIQRDDDSMGFIEVGDVDEFVDSVLGYPERDEPILLWDRG